MGLQQEMEEGSDPRLYPHRGSGAISPLMLRISINDFKENHLQS